MVQNKHSKPTCAAEQSNQRRTLRVPLIVEKLSCSDGRKTFFGYASNISRGGVFVATVNPREPGEQFDLQVALPPVAQLTLRCRCEVVWKRHFKRMGNQKPGMGLRFLDLPQEDSEALERWLHSLAGRSLP